MYAHFSIRLQQMKFFLAASNTHTASPAITVAHTNMCVYLQLKSCNFLMCGGGPRRSTASAIVYAKCNSRELVHRYTSNWLLHFFIIHFSFCYWNCCCCLSNMFCPSVITLASVDPLLISGQLQSRGPHEISMDPTVVGFFQLSFVVR